MQYDSEVLETLAARLYAEADSIMLRYALLMGLFGGLMGAAIAAVVKSDVMGTMAMGGLTILGGLLGAIYGKERGFMIRVQAQTILCQVQIEKNTRQQKS